MSKKANQDIKQLRAIGHKLKPVVTIAGKGLTEGVIDELDRALTDHELIKVKLAVGSREARSGRNSQAESVRNPGLRDRTELLAMSSSCCARSAAHLIRDCPTVLSL